MATKIEFRQVDWLPTDNEKEISLHGFGIGRASVGKNADGLIDNVIFTAGNQVMAYCSRDCVLPAPPDGFVFVK